MGFYCCCFPLFLFIKCMVTLFCKAIMIIGAAYVSSHQLSSQIRAFHHAHLSHTQQWPVGSLQQHFIWSNVCYHNGSNSAIQCIIMSSVSWPHCGWSDRYWVKNMTFQVPSQQKTCDIEIFVLRVFYASAAGKMHSLVATTWLALGATEASGQCGSTSVESAVALMPTRCGFIYIQHCIVFFVYILS